MVYSVNEPEKFWKYLYEVTLCNFAYPIKVNANHEQDALDYAVDYAEEQGWEGYFLDENHGYHENDVIIAGNHGRLLLSHEIHIEKVKG